MPLAVGRVEKELERVLGLAVLVYLIVHVIAGRTAGAAYPTEDVPAPDMLTGLDVDLREVSVACRVSEPVGQKNRSAEATNLARTDHDAISGGSNLIARRC